MSEQAKLDALAIARWDLHQTRQQLKETKQKLCHLEASYRAQYKRVVELEREFDDADEGTCDLAAIVVEE